MEGWPRGQLTHSSVENKWPAKQWITPGELPVPGNIKAACKRFRAFFPRQTLKTGRHEALEIYTL